jgi:lysophospholipid hydrolase
VWSTDHYAGLFYVIEGFLDILLFSEEPDGQMMAESKLNRLGTPEATKKLLFTVKPGGIAGYLGDFL